MTKEGWKHVIQQANTNEESLDLLARLLAEQDKAKSDLSNVFGCTGMPWAEIVTNVLEDAQLRGVQR
jgi:hypothetical protein